MKHRTTVIATAVAAVAVAAPATADAAKYRGTAWTCCGRAGNRSSPHKITFRQKGKKISKVDTRIWVYCPASPPSYDAAGFERFNPPGKFKLGKKTRRHASRHSAVYGGEHKRRFEFTVKPKRKSRTKIAGTLRLSYSFSTFDPYENATTVYNCSGTSTFTAKKR